MTEIIPNQTRRAAGELVAAFPIPFQGCGEVPLDIQVGVVLKLKKNRKP
jgi:hypothetical protein